MKCKSKILFLFMAFALTFMLAINVKAEGCVSNGATGCTTECSGASSPSQCASAGYRSCCTWQDPECTGNTTLVDHECVPVEGPTTCPAGQELNTEGTACVACRDHYYKAGEGIACSYCDGTVNASKTHCTPRATNVTVSISASKKDNVQPGETVTLTVSKNPTTVSGEITCSGGSNGCTSFTCPETGNGGMHTITATMTCSNCNVTNGSVVITCAPAKGTKVASIKANPTTVHASANTATGLNLSAYDAEGRAVDADWTGSEHITASCTGTNACGASVTINSCGKWTETVSAKGSGTNTGSATATITIIGYTEWSPAGRVQVPQDKRGHTMHEAEVATNEEDRCVAYENVDPKLGIGDKYTRCCNSGGELPYCYQKPDGTREITTYKDGYVKKDEKYCEKACYKKTDGTFVNTWFEDGYEKVEDRNCDSTPTPHCYKTPEGVYVQEVYKEGYVQVDDQYCVKACYKKQDGTVEQTGYQEGYVRLDDKYCVKACYKTGEDKYETTYYQDGYEKVDDSKCTDVPPTAASVSKIIYALSLFLVMAGSGIIVYQLTKTKRELSQ